MPFMEPEVSLPYSEEPVEVRGSVLLKSRPTHGLEDNNFSIFHYRLFLIFVAHFHFWVPSPLSTLE